MIAPYRILITGPQGSGKSTQAKILARKLNIGLINAGALVRDFAEEDTPEGRKVREDMGKGNLVDNNVTGRLVRQKVEEFQEKGFVVDGYPRSLEQLSIFDPQFKEVFCLNISDEEAVKRLIPRGREDDTRESIMERLKVYHKLTEPVLDHYRNLGILNEIDGRASIPEIALQIEKEVEEVG